MKIVALPHGRLLFSGNLDSGNLDAVRPDFYNRPRPVGDVGSYVRCNRLATSLGDAILDADIVAQVQFVQAHRTAAPDLSVAIHVKNDGAEIVFEGNRFIVDRN
jgi:hypothetical protein